MTFHPLQRRHFSLLAGWLAEPLVARWWNHETSPEAIERDFGPSVDGYDATKVLLAVVGGRPFGLIQRFPLEAYAEYLQEISAVCAVPSGALSVDYLVGEPDARRRGLGTTMIARFVEQSWVLCPQANDVIVPVSVANRASWRALERAGFRRIAQGHLEPDNPCDSRDHYIYRSQRPRREAPKGDDAVH